MGGTPISRMAAGRRSYPADARTIVYSRGEGHFPKGQVVPQFE